MLSLVQEARQQGLAKYAHPVGLNSKVSYVDESLFQGFWNDLDMMEIGTYHFCMWH